MENYGFALKLLRLHFKYTQREIADKVGVSNHAVSKWENGINQPDISTLRCICDIYGITTEQFFCIASGESVEEVLAKPQEESAPQPNLQEENKPQTPPTNPALQGTGMHLTEKTPLYKRWWAWLILGVLATSTAVGVSLALGDEKWGDNESSQHAQSVLESEDKESVSSESSDSQESSDLYVLYLTGGYEGTDWRAPISLRIGEKVTLPDCAHEREGYAFVGWLHETSAQRYEAGDTFSLLFEKDACNFIAQWEPLLDLENSYAVQFVKQDGTLLSETRYSYGEEWTVSDSIVTGYTFDFWLCNGEKYDGGDTFCVTEGEEYLFVAHYTPNKFRVLYKIPIHSYFYEKEVVYLYDGENYLRAGLFPEESGEYHVDGWMIDGVEYSANAFIGNLSSKDGAIFEAVPIWEKGVAEYVSLTFHCGDTEDDFSFVLSACVGEKVTMPVCEWDKNGYTFKGWKNEKTGEVYLVGEAFALPSGEDEHFTAVWEPTE